MFKLAATALCLAMVISSGAALADSGASLTTPETESRWRGQPAAPGQGKTGKDGTPAAGWRPRNLIRLKSGPGWRVREPHHAWGTPLSVSRLRNVLQARHRQFPSATAVPIYDLSAQHGGPLEGHYSHRRGRDADVGTPDLLQATGRWRQRDRDLEHTLFLVLALLRTCDVEFILLDREAQRMLLHHALSRGLTADEAALIFQAPGRGPFGMVRHKANHRQHIHVRFRKEANSDEPPRTPRVVSDRESREELCVADAGRPLIEKIFSRLYE